LVVKLSSLGDVIQTLPVLPPLKRKYPDANITWLVEEESAQLIGNHPLIDHLLVFRKKKWLKDVANLRKWAQFFREMSNFVKELRLYTYDLIIDFQGLLKSGMFVGICRGKRKVGFCPGREKSHIFLNEKIPFPTFTLHAIDRYLYLIKSLGCSSQPPEFSIPVRQVHRDRIVEFFQEKKIDIDKPVVILHPGTRWKTKMWEENKWALLGDLLCQKNGAQIILTGSREDFSLVRRITSKMRLPGINTAGKWGLKELAFLQTQAHVIVVPDSGPMHLAAALGTPVVALFGPTDQTRTGPYGNIHKVIIKPVECRPCFQRTCTNNKCMTEISVREVWEATASYLACTNTSNVMAK